MALYSWLSALYFRPAFNILAAPPSARRMSCYNVRGTSSLAVIRTTSSVIKAGMNPEIRSTGGSRESSSGALPSIQILRALAALQVAGYHVQLELSYRLGLRDALPDLFIGAAGVDLFFVISGFIMVYASEALFGRSEAPRIFFLRRLARIVPLYWTVSGVLLAYMALIAGVDFTASNISIGTIVASFLFLPYPRPDGSMMPLHGLGWTLNYEMFFYAIFAVATLVSRRRAVIAITAGFAAIVALNRLLGPLPQPLAFWCDPVILEFCFGMLVALAYFEGLRLPKLAAYVLILAGIIGYGATALSAANAASRVIDWGVPATAIVGGMVLCRNAPQPGILGRALARIGDASYSLYLLHPLVFAALRRALSGFLDLQRLPWIWAPIFLLIAVAAAVVTYLFFEKPVTRALQKRTGGFRSRPTGTPAMEDAGHPTR
jgi:exopolysaccharide production protein ExoZ